MKSNKVKVEYNISLKNPYETGLYSTAPLSDLEKNREMGRWGFKYDGLEKDLVKACQSFSSSVLRPDHPLKRSLLNAAVKRILEVKTPAIYDWESYEGLSHMYANKVELLEITPKKAIPETFEDPLYPPGFVEAMMSKEGMEMFYSTSVLATEPSCFRTHSAFKEEPESRRAEKSLMPLSPYLGPRYSKNK